MKVHTQKKLGLLVILLTIFQTVSCSQGPAESLSLSNAESSKFDDRDLYNFEQIEVEVDPRLGESIAVDTMQPVVLEDKIVRDYFTTNEIKTLITQQTKNGKTIRTTKKWSTRNPSYFTWANAGLAAAAVGAAGLYASGLNIEDFQKAAGNISSGFGLGKQNEVPADVAAVAPVDENVNTDAQEESSMLQKALPYAVAAGGIYLGAKAGPAIGSAIGGLGGSAVGGVVGAGTGAVSGALGRATINGARATTAGGTLVGVTTGAAGGAAMGGAGGGLIGFVGGPIAGGYAGYKGGEIVAKDLAKPSAQSVQTAPAIN